MLLKRLVRNTRIHVWIFPMVILSFFVAFLVFSHATVAIGGSKRLPQPQVSSGKILTGVPFAPLPVLEGWAQYSPVYPVKRYREPPKECKITQVSDTFV